MTELRKARWREEPLPVIDRARSLEAARLVQSGAVRFPLCCGHCNSPSVQIERITLAITGEPQHRLHCVQCGRQTKFETAHTIRRQKILRFIREGVDIDVSRTHTPNP